MILSANRSTLWLPGMRACACDKHSFRLYSIMYDVASDRASVATDDILPMHTKARCMSLALLPASDAAPQLQPALQEQAEFQQSYGSSDIRSS
jgi:hypothetical protein